MNALAAPFDTGDGDVFARIAGDVERQGYCVVDTAVPAVLVQRLFAHLANLPEHALQRAGIGREDEHTLNRFVRTDETRWLERSEPSARDFLDWMEQLRLGVNRRLFLGLFDYEAHFARYAPGAFYRKHYDAFADGTTNRVLSTVLYLNPNWQPGDGGEMLLYAPDDDARELQRVAPLFGRLVVFLSERFAHEVLPTRVTRFSIAGWFRVNASLNGQLDPPR